MVTHLFIKYNDYLLKLAQISLYRYIRKFVRYFKLRQKYDLETVL
jgi:hypothetical protein